MNKIIKKTNTIADSKFLISKSPIVKQEQTYKSPTINNPIIIPIQKKKFNFKNLDIVFHTRLCDEEEEDDVQEGDDELTEYDNNRLTELCDNYLSKKAQIKDYNKKIKILQKESDEKIKDIHSIMKKFGISELTRNDFVFVHSKEIKKRGPKKKDIKDVIKYTIHDNETLEEIYKNLETLSKVVSTDKVKCKKNY